MLQQNWYNDGNRYLSWIGQNLKRVFLTICGTGCWCPLIGGGAENTVESMELTFVGDELHIGVVDSITYTITFNANEGVGNMESQIVTRGAKTGLIGNSFTREGYDFTGWNTQADGKGTSYEDKATVTLANNMTLYAQWKQRTYTITFVPNARKVGGKMEQQEVVEGKDTALSPNIFTKKGYTFVGWNTQSDGKGTSYADKAVVNLKEDLKLYAQWKENAGDKKDNRKKEETQENKGKQWL